jgi:hypothetical protein
MRDTDRPTMPPRRVLSSTFLLWEHHADKPPSESFNLIPEVPTPTEDEQLKKDSLN